MGRMLHTHLQIYMYIAVFVLYAEIIVSNKRQKSELSKLLHKHSTLNYFLEIILAVASSQVDNLQES